MTPFALTLALALAAEPAPAGKTDRFGDPLPPGAVQRLGTLRHRTGWPITQHRLYVPDGRTLLTFRGEFRWTDSESGREIDRWTPPPGQEISGVSTDGRLAVLVDNKALHIWDLAVRRELRTIPDANRLRGLMSAALFSPDSRHVVLVDQDEQAYRRVRCWDVATGALIWKNDRLVLPGTRLFLVGFRRAGRSLVVQEDAAEPAVFVLDGVDGHVVQSFKTRRGLHILSPEGAVLLVGGGAIRSWDLDTGRERPQWGHADGASHYLTFSADGTRLASSGPSGTVLIWDWPSGRFVKQIPLGLDMAEWIGFTPDGKKLAASDFAESLIRFWDVDTGQPVPPPDGHACTIDFVRFTADGAVVTAGKDGAVRLWDVTTGRTLRQFQVTGLRQSVWFLAASADGRTLLTGQPGSLPQAQLTTWDTATGRGQRVLAQPISAFQAAISPDGRRLAVMWNSGSGPENRQNVGILHVGEAEFACHIQADNGAVMTFAPDGRFLATAGAAGPQVWDAATGRRVWQGNDYVNGLAFASDGRSLACADRRTLRLYETASGQERLRIDTPECHFDRAFGLPLDVSPDGRWLAALHGSGIGVWDVGTGRLAQTFEGHRAGVTSLAFAPDSRTLASASCDTTVLLWAVRDAPPESVPLSGEASATAWADLASSDAAFAYRAVSRLRADPAKAVETLRGRLAAASASEAEQIARCIVDLDDDRFAVRSKAVRELEALGDRAAPALRRLLAGRPSLEVRRRAEQLLGKSEGPITSREALRELRAVEVLERIATPEARRLLADLAAGAADARLTEEAKASLKRLK